MNSAALTSVTSRPSDSNFFPYCFLDLVELLVTNTSFFPYQAPKLWSEVASHDLTYQFCKSYKDHTSKPESYQMCMGNKRIWMSIENPVHSSSERKCSMVETRFTMLRSISRVSGTPSISLSPFQITPAHGNYEKHWATHMIRKLVSDSYQNFEGFYALLSL